MKLKTATTVFAILATICITAVLSSAAVTEQKATEAMEWPVPSAVLSPDVPTSVTFAGEEISLTTQDRRERMDREMLAFSYSHINTMLQIKRANRLFPIIEPILKECGVPEDLKYLMIIESNGDFKPLRGGKRDSKRK